MAIEVPENATEIDQRMKVDVKRELDGANPFLKNSWIGALITAKANRIFDFYYALRMAQLEAIPSTAVLSLEDWAAIFKITRNPATPASGNLALTGAVGGTVISGATTWVSTTGQKYVTTAGGVIALQSLSVTSIIEAGGVATLTTVSDHNLASNVLITVTGADQSEYNLTGVVCTVTGAKTLTYAVSGSPIDATGTILLGFTSVSVPVQSEDYGESENQLFDATLTLQSPIVDVDDDASADYGALGNGTDQELNSGIKARLTYRIQNPIAHFNVAEITSVALAITGVTRVFVQEITPDIGEVTVYFMRDNDADPIPDSSEVAEVKAVIDGIKPANTDTLDVHVYAPVPKTTNFVFSSITPDTTTMRAAIENSLMEFYAQRTEVATNIVEEAYNAAIFNTYDLAAGAELESFTLTSPAADITVAAGEIGKLGNVTF